MMQAPWLGNMKPQFIEKRQAALVKLLEAVWASDELRPSLCQLLSIS